LSATIASSISKNQRKIQPRYVVIKTRKLLEIIKKTKIVKKGICRFNFNLYDGKIADFNNLKNTIDKEEGVDYSEYLDNFKQFKK